MAPDNMSGQIFISYRRNDASFPAGRIYDRLAAHFRQNQIFMDVDNLDPGSDFLEAVRTSVGSCEVLVAVIGKHWLIASDEEGRRRLENPDDLVRWRSRPHSNVTSE
ncbi:MAG: toll/interleukin-1 receptor domain-containing protein [Verrucomicrobia bacterium]|nr:toll/interleukin-1 receptor domain-containing protein [Verrucomicrobiota bacterium]